MEHDEFHALWHELEKAASLSRLKAQRHHIHSNVYDHSKKVAYLLYRHHKRFHSKAELRELLRGAMLHDYYLYDRNHRTSPHRLHGIVHPRYALKNALRHHPELSPMERDMIRRHMFPLTIIPPKTTGGWLICFYDKLAAVDDFFRGKREKKSTSG